MGALITWVVLLVAFAATAIAAMLVGLTPPWSALRSLFATLALVLSAAMAGVTLSRIQACMDELRRTRGRDRSVNPRG